ncbi:uncharacterized protein V6R79_020432 [Siganus canaliculatus]
MERQKLSDIDEQLDSTEVAALCFLCRDVVPRKRLQGVGDAKTLFLRLEEKGLLYNQAFLSQLLYTIRRADLLVLLETDGRRPLETDAIVVLSDYTTMLYRVYDDMTEENLDKMKFLLRDKIPKRQIESCKTALDVFSEMERTLLLSPMKLDELRAALNQFDQQLVSFVDDYVQGLQQRRPHVSMDYQRQDNIPHLIQTSLSISETGHPGVRSSVCSDAEPSTKPSLQYDETEYYILRHNPRGLCVIFNNESFTGTTLGFRAGTEMDKEKLKHVFGLFGFIVVEHKNLTAGEMRHELNELGARNFTKEDALVVCVLSHGEKGCVFGCDGEKVMLDQLTDPFTSGNAPTLAGKPKLFFIQACQGRGYQRGAVPCPPRASQDEKPTESIEEDAGPVYGETVPWHADFLLGMATVQECKSFRHTTAGSIYIQELCRQLERAAESSEADDILTVLTRVNREVSQGEYLRHKQMPEPKYTFTKKLVLKFV